MKKHKWISYFLSLLAIFTVFGATNVHKIFAGEVKPDVKITNFTLSHEDGSTNQKFHYNERFKINMEWDASSYSNTLKEGDYFNIKLPDNMKFPTNTSATKFEIKDSSGKVIANAVVSPNANEQGGMVKVTFTKEVENHYNIKGKMELAASFTNIKYDEKNKFEVSVDGKVQTTEIEITGPNPLKDEEIGKWGTAIKESDNTVQWYVRINHKKGTYKNFVYKDGLWTKSGDLGGVHLIPDSFHLYEVEYDQYGGQQGVIKEVDIKDKLTLTDNNTKFELAIGDINKTQYKLEYKSTYIPGSILRNKAKGTYTNGETHEHNETFHDATSSGSGSGSLLSKLRILKVDAENNTTKLAGAKFSIKKLQDGTTFELTTDANGEATSDKLVPGQYEITEVTPPAGYELNSETYTVTITSDDATLKTITNKRAKTSVKVNKKWVGKTGSEVKVELQAGGTTVAEATLNQANNWEHTFDNLEQYKDGKLIDYTVKEVEVEEGYQSKVEGNATDGYTITNTYTPAPDTKAKIAGKKVLEGKILEAGKYSFVLKKADGSVVQTVTNDVGGNFAFDELTYDENQVGTHKYTVEEVAGTETGITYDKTIQEVEVKVEKISATELKATVSKQASDLVFTNKYTPAKTQIPVKKVWDDADNQDGKRPASITVKLLADGQDTGKTLELSEANGWSGNFTDLDADKGGKAIDYKVVEVSTVAGYTSEISGDATTGFTITNKYTPETIDIKATKNWDDANNQDGKRPKSITVNLMADGEKVASQEVKAAADGTWSTVFTKLPKFKNGKVIKYSLTEEVVSEYTSEINDFNITNKYTPKMIDYQVTKTWNDNNNQDGKRPDHITVHLLKTVGGVTTEVEKYDIKVAEADPANGNVWKHTFTNLPKYETGQEIVYSVKEDAVAGYETSIKGQEITNTHDPETIVISGKKVWEDANNQDGKRTKTVKVQILKGGTIVDEVETSEEKGWAFESKPLPKYENGKEIEYDVKEVAVESYEKPIVEKSQDGKYTITNKRTPEKVNLTGQKTWEDDNDKDGLRPKEIQVRLLANGKDTGKVATASAATGWKYSFEQLAKYEAGKEITYTVEEVAVPEGYTAKVEGMNITNRHTPEKPQTPPSTPEKPKKTILPSTGSHSSFLALFAGLFTLGGAVYLLKKKV
ncbi:Cna B-type domain-containing protein [Streptococcus sp. KHUD_010]|uniref:Cna B-type domain-containing protein n=1 Tax=Streptococcus sp. KHUD_010 TaxID=3157339 RepID=A0AAU7PYY5_9STRE